MFDCVGLYLTRIHTGSSLLGMLFIYLLARYIKLYYTEVSLKYAVTLWLLPVIIVIILMIASLKAGHSGVSWSLLWYCNPLIIMSGVGLFFIFNNVPQFHSRLLNWMGRHCLSIYLITEINKPIYKFWATEFNNNFLWAIILVILSVVFFMTIDTIQSYVNKKITKFLIQRIDNKMYEK